MINNYYISKNFKRLSEVILVLAFILPLFIFTGCSGDDKLDLSQFPITNGGGNITVSDTVYVQQSPTWNQFNGPEGIIVGNEPVIYAADTKNNRIVQLDLAGVEIGTLGINNPTALTQDLNFDLLVISDSLVSTGDTLSVVYRIKTVPAGGIITYASKITLLASDYPTPLVNKKRKFTGISTYADNSYIITRVGPNNGSLDPDNALLKVKGRDAITSLTVINGFQPTGNGIYSLEKTSGVFAIRNSLTDFIITRNSTDFGFKVLWFTFDNVNGSYAPKFFPESNADIVTVQLGTPEDVTMDTYNNIYVVDAAQNSLVKFSATGKRMKESFGGFGTGANKLNAPKGVAIFNKVLYIADTGNNRIVRYKLSTDIN